jgi:hypothetical protein
MAMVESALGAVPRLPSVRFPRPLAAPAMRVSTQTGSPLCLRSGGVGQGPGVGNLGAAIPVSGDRDLGQVEQLHPIGRGSHPAAVAASVVSADHLRISNGAVSSNSRSSCATHEVFQ